MQTTQHSFAHCGIATWMLRHGGWAAFIIGIICYLNVLPNDYANDGIPIIKVSEKVNDPGQWGRIWTTDYWSKAKDDWVNRDLLYRPMAISTYRLVRMVAGVEPWPQHLVNIFLHGLASALIVRLSRRLGVSPLGSLAAGVLFAILPIHHEVIANIVGRADMLATNGVLIALLVHRRLIYSSTRREAVLLGIIVATAAFVAVSAKESAVAMVGVLAFFDWYWARERDLTRSASFSLSRYVSFAAASRMLCVVVPTVIYLCLRFNALGGQLHQKPALTKTVNVLVDAPLWQHALGVTQLWGMYWAKTVWPSVLSVTYAINDVRLATSIFDPHVLIGLLAAGCLLVASVRAARQGRWLISVLVLSVIVAYLPTSNALVLLQIFFAERIWYLPSIFICILLGIGFAKLPWQRGRDAVAVVLILAMMGRCWIRSTEWKDNGTLSAAAYRDAPNGIVAMCLYGYWLCTNGAPEKGIELFERAIQVDLGYIDAYRMLGVAYLEIGRYDKAVQVLQIANMHAPGHALTTSELEYAVAQLAKSTESELTNLREKADASTADVSTELAYIRALRDLGNPEEALQRFAAQDAKFSSVAEWHQEYAVTLLYLNQRDEAFQRYARAVELAPANAQLLIEYAMLLLERREGGDLAQAQGLAERASAITPDAPFVLVCHAELHALRGDLNKAIELYRKAIAGLPPNSPQRTFFEERLRALGG